MTRKGPTERFPDDAITPLTPGRWAQRAESAGLVCRERDQPDQRRIHLELTDHERQQLESLTRAHLPRIKALAGILDHVLQGPGVSR